jgi:integrase
MYDETATRALHASLSAPQRAYHRNNQDLFISPALLPLQFSSLEHFDRRVDAACFDMAGTEGLSASTIAWARAGYSAFRRYLKDSRTERAFLGGELSGQLQLLDGWLAHLRAKQTARSTINGYWRAMRMLCTRLQRKDGVVNPWDFRRAPGPGVARLQCLTQDAAERVLAFVQNDGSVSMPVRVRNTAVIAIMLFAGLRKSEVLRLTVNAVDFDAHVIRVIAGKGPDGGKHRTVPMTTQLEKLLRDHKSHRVRAKVGSPSFFLGTRGCSGLSDITLRRLFNRISERTGIHVSPHMLRHTFCTLLSKFGIPDRLAREAMGHADERMLRRYQHVYEGEVADAMKKFVLNLGIS